MTHIPVGTILSYAGDATVNGNNLQMEGWLFCDGSMISRKTYYTLFSVIGTRYGQGDGSTTFNLPDFRGRFLRGTDHGANHDPDAANRTAINSGGVIGDNTGSLQAYATALPVSTNFSTDNPGDHTHSVNNVPVANTSYKIKGSSISKWNSGSVDTLAAGNHTHLINNGGDAETRPTNVYVDYIISFQ